MSIFKECPICLETKLLITPMCKHKLCSLCIGYLCSSDCQLEKKCPICRKSYSLNEILSYCELRPKSINYEMHEIFKQKIKDLNSKSQIEEVQLNAIDNFFNGKIDYAQMRRLAG